MFIFNLIANTFMKVFISFLNHSESRSLHLIHDAICVLYVNVESLPSTKSKSSLKKIRDKQKEEKKNVKWIVRTILKCLKLLLFKPYLSYTMETALFFSTGSTASKRQKKTSSMYFSSNCWQLRHSFGPFKQAHLGRFMWGTYWTIVLTVWNRFCQHWSELFQ